MEWWFQKEKPRPQQPVNYPDGLAVDTEEAVYYVRKGRKYQFYSDRTFESWNLDAVRGSEASLSKTPRAKAYMGFRDGTLINNFADGKMYLISNSKRRHITNPDALDRLGIEIESMWVSEAETMLHDEGEPIG